MSAANLQGVLASTIDVDLWIDLPSRQYIKVLNLCKRLEATPQSANKVYLADATPVDFIYEVSGLGTFAREFAMAKRLPFHGLRIPVLALERICRNKRAAARDKDKLHIALIRQVISAGRSSKRRKPSPPARKAGPKTK